MSLDVRPRVLVMWLALTKESALPGLQRLREQVRQSIHCLLTNLQASKNKIHSILGYLV